MNGPPQPPPQPEPQPGQEQFPAKVEIGTTPDGKKIMIVTTVVKHHIALSDEMAQELSDHLRPSKLELPPKGLFVPPGAAGP